ncbi:MAG TPA: hypothetical protein VJP84_14580 [Steroidobacteraceae bacterium]|jgi:hypothetical protein|nr:hypothetical protein [Steroidobacteraceae bacterium]
MGESVFNTLGFSEPMASRPGFHANDTSRDVLNTAVAHCVPHGAFDDPGCPAGVIPRASLEMRGIAYWFD